MIYTGVGARATPQEVCLEFYSIAQQLGKTGLWTLRSGGANGADSSFERGCRSVNGAMDIYLPWKNFNENSSLLYNISEEALKLAESIHYAWSKCTQNSRKLHARNCYQVLGYNLNKPSDFLLCWTDKGKAVGGTRTAIKLAETYNVPVFNFGKKSDKEKFYETAWYRVAVETTR